jgi:peptide/nickel transport system ATP-binding protein
MRVAGSICLDGRELAGAPQHVYRPLRGRRMAYVPQDALSVLSPVHTVGHQLALAVRSVQRLGRKAAHERAVAALDRVGIPDAARRARAYPQEFSGGMRQRTVIAMATINDPAPLIADEPTTALDPTIQDQILRVLDELRARTGMALVLVTHDLGVAAGHADRLLVMYAGRAVESGPAAQVLNRPGSPYTAGLVASLPPTHANGRRLPAMPGTPAVPGAVTAGCAFAPRCPAAIDHCRTEEPDPRELSDGRLVACLRKDELPQPTTTLYQRTAE